MLNADFYPTPENVAAQMLANYDVTDKVVLEPSAGKGDLVDFIKQSGARSVIACEIEPELQKILATKCRVIAPDFLSIKAEDISHVNAIIMNPPFSKDEVHILHAFDIAPAGCTILALCNFATFSNAHTQKRQQLNALIGQYGSIQYLGDCFSNAERKTGVEIGLVSLTKPGESKDEFEGFYMDEEPEQEQVNGLMPYNFARELVNRYIAAVRLFDKQIELGQQMNALTSSFYSSKIAFSVTKDGAPALRQDFINDLQKNAWQWVFNKMNMDKYTTQGLKADINKFVESQHKVPFTMKNIYKMIDIVIGTHSSRMDRAIIEVFDKLTQHYHDNRYNVEGWKTNSHYLMGEKFILGWITEPKYSRGMGLRYGGNCKLIDDMNKALCHITGTNFDSVGRLWNFIHNSNKEHFEWGQWYDWGFFQIRGYKKGSMHFKFKSREVWAIFNQNVARIKGYPLPESVKKAA